jgi:histone acetyltransferase (RNA polymerase elongator complex component)
MVVSGTELERWKQEGSYKPYEEDVLIDLIADLKALFRVIPAYPGCCVIFPQFT